MTKLVNSYDSENITSMRDIISGYYGVEAQRRYYTERTKAACLVGHILKVAREYLHGKMVQVILYSVNLGTLTVVFELCCKREVA